MNFTCRIVVFTDMERRFRESNRGVIGATTLQYVYDIRAWITPVLNEIHNHTVPHVFRFRRNLQGKAEMHYKHWSHEPWQPSGAGLVLLKVI